MLCLYANANAGPFRQPATMKRHGVVYRAHDEPTAMNMWNFEEAEECLQRALRHDPVNIWANVFQPTVFIYSGKLNDLLLPSSFAFGLASTKPTPRFFIAC